MAPETKQMEPKKIANVLKSTKSTARKVFFGSLMLGGLMMLPNQNNAQTIQLDSFNDKKKTYSIDGEDPHLYELSALSELLVPASMPVTMEERDGRTQRNTAGGLVNMAPIQKTGVTEPAKKQDDFWSRDISQLKVGDMIIARDKIGGQNYVAVVISLETSTGTIGLFSADSRSFIFEFDPRKFISLPDEPDFGFVNISGKGAVIRTDDGQLINGKVTGVSNHHDLVIQEDGVAGTRDLPLGSVYSITVSESNPKEKSVSTFYFNTGF